MNRIDAITMTNLLRQSVAGLRAMLVLTVLLGVLNPAAVWTVGSSDSVPSTLIHSRARAECSWSSGIPRPVMPT